MTSQKIIPPPPTRVIKHYSSFQCFNATITDFSFADQNKIRRGVQPDNNISGPAPNTGMPVRYAPPVETGPRHKGGELFEPPILTMTTPQRSNPWSPAYGGGIEVEVSKVYSRTDFKLPEGRERGKLE